MHNGFVMNTFKIKHLVSSSPNKCVVNRVFPKRRSKGEGKIGSPQTSMATMSLDISCQCGANLVFFPSVYFRLITTPSILVARAPTLAHSAMS